MCTTPGTKEKVGLLDGDEAPEAEARLYKSVTMRAQFLGHDRPDVQFQVKECARAMARPTISAMQLLKNIARYLKGHRRLVWRLIVSIGRLGRIQSHMHCSGGQARGSGREAI